MRRTPTLLAATALLVALLGITPLGQAAANVVRVAVFAQNAGKVGNIRASHKPVAGQLLALDAKGKFPSSVLPPQTPGYVSTIIVSPDRANNTKSGTLLRDAMAGISDNGPSRSYLLKIEPGTYDLGSEPLAMKPYVDVEGSGELSTIIAATGATPGVVVATSNSELRFLSVRGTAAPGLVSVETSPRYTHVTATSTGGAFNYAIEITGGAPILTSVTGSGTGGAQTAGLVNFGSGSNVTITDSSFSGSGAASVNIGLLAYGTNTISSSVLSANGGSFAVGLRVYNGSHSLANVTSSGSGAPEAYGLYSGYKGNTPTVTANQSRISGGTNSIYVFGGAARIGASQLTGDAAVFAPATITCAASYNGSFAQLTPSCGSSD